MLFAATAVANGSCRGIVNAIGMDTEVGKIQQQITEAAAEEEDTPLKKKLDVFGERLAQVWTHTCLLLGDGDDVCLLSCGGVCWRQCHASGTL